jgi:histidinol-phosphatase
MVDPVAEVWDLAPVSVLVTEAGGKFTSLSGGDFISERNAAASNGLLHDEVLSGFKPCVGK